MKIILGSFATKVLARCLNCLAKAGRELLISTTANNLLLSATDDSGATHLIFAFGSAFFESFDPQDAIRGRVPLQLFVRAFKIDNYIDLERTELFGTTRDPSNGLHVHFTTKFRILRSLRFPFHEGPVRLPARFLWKHRHYCIASRETLHQVFHQYADKESSLLQDITIFPEVANGIQGLRVRLHKERKYLNALYSIFTCCRFACFLWRLIYILLAETESVAS